MVEENAIRRELLETISVVKSWRVQLQEYFKNFDEKVYDEEEEDPNYIDFILSFTFSYGDEKKWLKKKEDAKSSFIFYFKKGEDDFQV